MDNVESKLNDANKELRYLESAVKTIEKEHSFAWELIANARRDSKRWFIALMVVLGLWFATIGGFIGFCAWFLDTYEMSSYEVSTDGGTGDANYQSGTGNIINP